MSLLDYIQGKRKGKEAHRLEKEAMQDPFLADALEGFDKVEGEHIKAIESLQKRIVGKTIQKRNIVWSWGVAAGLLIGVLTGGYFFLKSDYIEDPMLAMESAAIIQDSISEKIDIEDKDLLARAEEVAETLTAPLPPIPPASIRESIMVEDSEIVVEDFLELAEEIVIEEKEEEAVEASEKRVDSVEDLLAGDLQGVEVLKQSAENPNAHKRVRGTSSNFSSSNIVQGKVIDKEGEPLMGASVRIEGTTRGTTTDMDGNFRLEVADNETISVDYIGFESQRFPVSPQQNMVIAMNESEQVLSEAIIIGYGGAKKKDKIKMPKPVDGERAYKMYLKNNMRYPSEGECKDSKGKVKLSFFVDGMGRPYHINVIESVCSSIDREAIRLVQEGPDWSEGEGEVILQIKF